MQPQSWALIGVGFLLAPFGMADADAQGQWENLQSLQEGQRTEVIQMDLKSFSGNFLSVSPDSIRLLVKKKELTIPRSDVFRVSTRSGSRRGRNAVIGAVIGAGWGVAAGAGVLAATNGSDFAGAIIGATTAIGAGVGGGLGAATPGYLTVYRAPKKPIGPGKP